MNNREEQYRSFIESAPMAVAMLDTDLHYLAVSDQWHRQYHLEEDRDLIGEHHYNVFPEIRDMPGWLETHQQCLQGKEFSKEEDVFERKDGTRQYIRRAIRPWYLSSDEIGGLLMYTEDITDIVEARKQAASNEKELEKKVAKRTEKLERANKDLEAFSYSVSHDLRTPLRAITGFGQILLEDHGHELGDEGQRLLNIIIDNTEKMATLIDDILSFSRVSRADLVQTEINMHQLFKDAVQTVKNGYSELDDKIELTINELPPAKGDMSLIKQVAVNLVSNAIKYSANSDSIQVEIGYQQEGEQAVYFIKDNGVGFDMKYENKLFGVFERLHSSAEFEGTGVGLSLVKRIIQQHNGGIWAESEPDKGATFFFHL